jgi:sugar O-acyltransferase (sialic acid O-acetyltransferase NeuD family)
VGGIGDLQIRLTVDTRLKAAGFFCPSVIHPTAFSEASTRLADGVQVFPFAYLGTEVSVSYGCIINTGVIVSHNCTLARFVNLSPGATLAGGVTVAENALIGMRATVNLNVHIGRGARIGNGATVKADVPDGGVVPAGTIWPPR